MRDRLNRRRVPRAPFVVPFAVTAGVAACGGHAVIDSETSGGAAGTSGGSSGDGGRPSGGTSAGGTSSGGTSTGGGPSTGGSSVGGASFGGAAGTLGAA